MAYNRTFWKDHVTEFENRFKEIDNGDGTITHEPVDGEVIQQGTPQNEPHFNNMEEGIFAANELACEIARVVNLHGQTLNRLIGEKGAVTLVNTLDYPFNNSKKTVSLAQEKQNLDYTVHVEAVPVGVGAVGEIIISDKQLNGFKIQHTGSAKQVDINFIVEGGTF